MSFLSRPDSPPPRYSPDIVLAPLPPPIRRRPAPPPTRPTCLSLQGAAAPPNPERAQRLASMRSCSDLCAPVPPRSPHSRFVVSAPTTPRSAAPPSPAASSSSFRRTHRRTLSFAVPYRSPPPSPTLASPPPPVPPIPAFVLSPTDKKPVLHRTEPAPVTHIYLPEWEQFTVAPPAMPPPQRKPRHSLRAGRASATPMTCSTFFALHSPDQRPAQVVAL